MKQLLGLAVLLTTMVSGYAVSRVPDADDRKFLAEGLDAHIREVANRYSVAPELVVAMIEVESSFNPRAVSRRGARGLMQLMPVTAATLGVDDPFDPRENVEAGVRYLRTLIDQFDNDLPLALAAYNAGRRAVITHRGIPPYRQTRQYVTRILRRLPRDVLPPARAPRHEITPPRQ